MSEHKNNKLFHMPGKPSKKAIIAIVCVLALAAIAFILVSSGIAGRILGSGNVSFTPLDAKDIPRAIEKDVIPEYRELERALGCVVDGKVYIVVTRGEKQVQRGAKQAQIHEKGVILGRLVGNA